MGGPGSEGRGPLPGLDAVPALETVEEKGQKHESVSEVLIFLKVLKLGLVYDLDI